VSDLEVESARQEMEASGELEFIRQHAEAAGHPIATDAAPAPEADTVTDEPVVEEVVEEETELTESGSPVEEETTLTEAEEDILYLELDDDTQALIDTKYGGDLSKALVALRESQSLLGRQGNELGDLRREMAEFRQSVERSQIMNQPYPEMPDEYEDPADAAVKYRAIAEQAFAREDVDTFSGIVDAWIEIDPLGGNTYRDLKLLQLQSAMQQQAPAAPQGDPQEVIAVGVAKVKEEYPQMSTPEFQAEFDAEIQKFPSLKGLLWGEIPGTTPEQRVAALRETVERIASRHSAETEEKARKRVAVKRSEAARQARVEGKVASGESARVAEPEVEKRTVPLGETGRSLDIDRLNAMLNPEDRI
jgi:hypothetical protein